MRRRLWAVGIAALALVVVAGCGGGGGEGSGAIAPAGGVSGTVDLAGSSADDYELLLDGAPVDAAIDPDGSFELSGVPEGEWAVDVVHKDGMASGRAAVVVQPGQSVEIPNPIVIEAAGQICGIVSLLEDGVLTPVRDAHVIARSDLAWILTDDGARLGPADAPDGPLVYPPPPGVTYHAFTGEDGSYCMRGVRPGSYLVVVALIGVTGNQAYVFVRPGHTAVADFVLRPLVPPVVGVVAGTVYGKAPVNSTSDVARIPLPGALVTVWCDNYWQPPTPAEPAPIIGTIEGDVPPDADSVTPPDIVWSAVRTRTDEDGRYRLKVPAGPALMTVWKRHYEPQRRRIRVPANDTIIENFFLRLMDDIVPLPVPDAD